MRTVTFTFKFTVFVEVLLFHGHLINPLKIPVIHLAFSLCCLESTTVKVKVKFSRYRPEQALAYPEG